MFPLPFSFLLIEPGKPFRKLGFVLSFTASVFCFYLPELPLQNVQDTELNSDAH
jgi:hypothetical protein